ncbi:MAG: T9SS type A sorting domain-containing protein [Candidatus Krumholzibacteria bacterium]|nr:T9SS type A sorting domain-containing protein [Candidatus Krumholzibacteria bacterium]
MKKFTMFACLALALVFVVSSFAEELPRVTDGNAMVYGGSVNFSKSGGDTINLMAAANDPTNETGEPLYFGDFQSGTNPNWNSWTHYDITEPTGTHWNVSTYNQPVTTNYAAWCGDITIDACNEDDVDGGYGNSWHDLIEFRQTVPNTDVSSLVTVTATLIHDSEPGYDYSYLSYRFQGQAFGDMQSWDGDGTVAVANSVTFLPPEYMDGTDIAVYFRFKSDGGWSDEDCSFPSAGGCQVDDINVNIDNGTFNADFFEDFEHGGVADDFGIWTVAFPDGVGDFAKLWTGLEDNDPCATNYTPQVAFVDDGVIVPGTGGSDCINWCYGPSGYIVNTTGGLAGPTEHLHGAIESPVMTWPASKGGGVDDDGITLQFSCYRHEDLSADAPGIFYTFGIRSADTDDSAGNGAMVITDEGWADRNFVYYGGPDYQRFYNNVTDLMAPGRDEVQVQLAVYELGWAWGWEGNDGYPAPYFDNVTVKVFPYNGPGMAGRELDLAQDNWPTRGDIDMGNPASHSVRFDMANNIALATALRNDPGDSLVIDVVPVRSGAAFVGVPTMHYIMKANPIFDAYRTTGVPTSGSMPGEVAVGIGGANPDRWAFDLPDSDFFFPGDIIHYYISATDDIGGLDPQTSLMPADTTGFDGDFDDPMGYNSTFVVRALPSISDAAGTQPTMLFLNDFANRGGENEWYMALNNIGLLVGQDYDVYYTNGPSSGVGNGIGGRTSALMLTGYDDMLYTSGNLGVNTIANADYNNDPGDDVGTITDWLDQGKHDIFLTGDDLASDMSQAGTATLAFLETKMGVTTVTNNIRPFIGNQTTPLVKAVAGNPVFGGTLQSWIAYGGCFSINTFDGVNVFGTGQKVAEFTDPSGAVGQYTFSAATLNIMNPGADQSRSVSMPVDLMYIYTDPSAAGNPLPGRAQLLKDVLAYFGVSGLPQNVSPVLPGITFQTSNYPNPFNPSTTIKFSVPKSGHVDLNVYNVRGQLVKTLVDGSMAASADHSIVWDGTNNQGSGVSSGVYFYEVRTGGEVKVQKMALVK